MKANTKTLIYANSQHEDGRYIAEAEKSCGSFKQYIKDTDSVLYCDRQDYRSENFDTVVTSVFSIPDALQTRMHKRGQMLVKHQAMLETDYDYNLVLGSDTYAISDKVASIFDLLDKFDIAIAHAPYRIVSMPDSEPIPVPESYPEFNCDVIAFRRNNRVMKLIEQWRELYHNDTFGHPHDQGTFRYLIYNSDLRVATLAPEFNYRGKQWRNDTVILQNRDLLDEYLSKPSQPERPGLKSKIRKLVKGN